MRKFAVLLVLALGVLLAWCLVDPERARAQLRPVLPTAVADLLFKVVDAGRAASPPALRDAVPVQGVALARKCVSGSAVEYTTGPCPPGSREVAMSGGTVTVVPGPAAALPASAPASLPTVRDLLVPPSKVDMQQQRVDQATR